MISMGQASGFGGGNKNGEGGGVSQPADKPSSPKTSIPLSLGSLPLCSGSLSSM